MPDEDIRKGLPPVFDSVPEDIIRVVEARILDTWTAHEMSEYHAAMFVACQFAFEIATGGTK